MNRRICYVPKIITLPGANIQKNYEFGLRTACARLLFREPPVCCHCLTKALKARTAKQSFTENHNRFITKDNS